MKEDDHQEYCTNCFMRLLEFELVIYQFSEPVDMGLPYFVRMKRSTIIYNKKLCLPCLSQHLPGIQINERVSEFFLVEVIAVNGYIRRSFLDQRHHFHSFNEPNH